MTQTKLESSIETFFNIGSGFILSFLMWIFVVGPLFGIPTYASQSFWITVLFTITSVLRSYVWRRYFNARLHKRVHAMLTEDSSPPKQTPMEPTPVGPLFAVGDVVTLYDRYMFATPLPGIIVRFSESNDGVEVRLLKSNFYRYPIGSTFWVHEAQLRKGTKL